MDILSHGLWGVLLGKLASKKNKLSLLWAFFWGIFPDLFAFSLLFIWGIMFKIGPHPPHSLVDATVDTKPLFVLTNTLYQFSHSLLIVGIIILIIWLLRKKIYYAMLAWPLHILMDIPTHTTQFYPTPYLWPLPHPLVNGFRWNSAWFMVLNITLMAVLFLWLFYIEKNSEK